MSTEHIAFIFPGQGSQYRGMGSDLCEEYPVARRIYERASRALGYDLAGLCFTDPDEQLNLTRFTQPALLTHSIACLEVFRELTDHRINPRTAAGHSLGEYSALVAAGSLRFEEALRLVQKRGELMGTYGEGEMLAFPVELEQVRPLAEKHYCAIAACNLPDQTVVGGRGDDLDRLLQEAQDRFPRKRPVRLKTEGAFHTYFMVSAAVRYREFLDSAAVASPALQVLSNFTGGYHEADPSLIKSRLFFQLFHPVLWNNNLQRLLQDGATLLVEFGGGIGSGETPAAKRPNLEGVIKKALRSSESAAQYFAVINNATLQATAETLLKML